MSKLTAALTVTLFLIFTAGISHADSASNSQVIIEGANITIRMTNNQPYAEFQPCEGCPHRLLSFSPTTQIYLDGQNTATSELQDGQTIKGTIFIQSTPIESIREIVAK